MFCALACVACLCRVAPGSTLQLVTSALSFLLAVKECSEHSLASWETWALLERGLNSLKPKFEENSECVAVRGVAPRAHVHCALSFPTSRLFRRLETAVSALRRCWAASS